VGRAGRFVQQFRYERDGEGALQLRTRFDTNALREALVRAGVPVWQRDRPPVLVWLAVERGGRREMVGSEQGATEREAMLEAAAELGLPLLFPLMDLEDQRRVSFADVAGGGDEPVLAASERYDTPVVLAGRLRASGEGWEARWLLHGPDAGRERWSDQAPALAALADAAVARIAASLREPYTLLPDLDRSRALEVRVTGLRGLADYAAAERALAALGGVTGVQPQEVHGELVRFRLQVNVAPDRVRRALIAGTRLDEWFPPARMLSGRGYLSWMRFPPGEQPTIPTFPSAIPSFSVSGDGGCGLSIAPFTDGIAVGLTTSGSIGHQAFAEQFLDEWVEALPPAVRGSAWTA